MRELHPRFYQISISGFVNIYVVRAQEGAAVIDTGIGKGTLNALRKHLPDLGYSTNDVRHILITHAHFDHIGGLIAMQRAMPKAQTYVSEIDAKIVTGAAPVRYARRSDLRGLPWLMSFMLAGATKPAKVQITMRDGALLYHIVPGLRAIGLPGHTDGQIGFYHAEAGVLIGGDVMMGHLPVSGLSMPLRAASPDWEACKASIRKVADLNLRILGLGHGTPLTENTAERVRALADKIAARDARRQSES